MDRDADGLLADTAQLYGMERFALDQLKVLEGDITKLYEPGGRYVAAVYSEDDYGTPDMDSHWARLGDTVKLQYVEEFEYYNPNTGEVYGEEIPENAPVASRAVQYREAEYTVAVLVVGAHAAQLPLLWKRRVRDERSDLPAGYRHRLHHVLCLQYD